MKDGDVLFFKYVKRADVPRYLEAGWIVVQVGKPCHHDFYACILEWTGPGEPPDMGEGRSDPDMESGGHDRPGDNRGAA